MKKKERRESGRKEKRKKREARERDKRDEKVMRVLTIIITTAKKKKKREEEKRLFSAKSLKARGRQTESCVAVAVSPAWPWRLRWRNCKKKKKRTSVTLLPSDKGTQTAQTPCKSDFYRLYRPCIRPVIYSQHGEPAHDRLICLFFKAPLCMILIIICSSTINTLPLRCSGIAARNDPL